MNKTILCDTKLSKCNLLSSCGPSGLPWWESKADFSSLVAKMKNWALLSRFWIVQKLFSYFIRLQRKKGIISESRMRCFCGAFGSSLFSLARQSLLRRFLPLWISVTSYCLTLCPNSYLSDHVFPSSYFGCLPLSVRYTVLPAFYLSARYSLCLLFVWLSSYTLWENCSCRYKLHINYVKMYRPLKKNQFLVLKVNFHLSRLCGAFCSRIRCTCALPTANNRILITWTHNQRQALCHRMASVPINILNDKGKGVPCFF